MQLVFNELLNSCRFTHLVARDVQLQNSIVLMIQVLNFFNNNENFLSSLTLVWHVKRMSSNLMILFNQVL